MKAKTLINTWCRDVESDRYTSRAHRVFTEMFHSLRSCWLLRKEKWLLSRSLLFSLDWQKWPLGQNVSFSTSCCVGHFGDIFFIKLWGESFHIYIFIYCICSISILEPSLIKLFLLLQLLRMSGSLKKCAVWWELFGI